MPEDFLTYRWRSWERTEDYRWWQFRWWAARGGSHKHARYVTGQLVAYSRAMGARTL